MSGKEKSRRNLGEDSMKMVTNIIKLSSFSIATFTLGTASSSPVAAKSPAPEVSGSGSGSGSGSDSDSLKDSQIPGSRRLQESRSSSKPISIMMQPKGANESSFVIHQEKRSPVDDRAWDYIRKVHKKNQNSFDETSRHALYVVPPPPLPPRGMK